MGCSKVVAPPPYHPTVESMKDAIEQRIGNDGRLGHGFLQCLLATTNQLQKRLDAKQNLGQFKSIMIMLQIQAVTAKSVFASQACETDIKNAVEVLYNLIPTIIQRGNGAADDFGELAMQIQNTRMAVYHIA